MTNENEKRSAQRRLRLAAALGAVSFALAFAALGGAPGTGPTIVRPAFAQDRDEHGHPPPPDEARRRQEEERAREERDRHVRYVPPPPAYVYTPPPVYYAPAAPSVNLDFIFPLK
jgi:hypothetical protein